MRRMKQALGTLIDNEQITFAATFPASLYFYTVVWKAVQLII